MDTARAYTGQYADALTGLDYYVSRYYDPVVGIFLSPDVKEGNAAGMNPYAYVGGNPETDTDPSGQYYSNGTQLGEHGGETEYVYNNEVVTVTNTGVGRFTPLSGGASWNYGSLNVNVSTDVQFARYGDYTSANDPQYSTAAKFAAVTGWTQLQQSWNAPGATTQSRLMALLHFGETNANNVLQLAMILGGGEDDGVAVVADDVGSSVAQEAGSILYRALRSDEDPAIGLFAEDPNATKPIWQHVLNGSKDWFQSQYISSTPNLSKAIEFASIRGGRIAAIDVSKIIGTTIDISTSSAATAAGLTGFAYSYAIHWQEVLIVGQVPPEAINWVRSVSDFVP